MVPSSSALPTTNEFPSPEDLPNAEVLIFDGNCGFCRGKVRTLRRFLGNRLAFLSLHDPVVYERYPDLDYNRLMREMVLVTRGHRRLGGARAVRHLARKSIWLWPVALLLHIPWTTPLWQRVYQWIAVRRYKLSAQKSLESNGDERGADGSDPSVGATAKPSDYCEDACSIHMK